MACFSLVLFLACYCSRPEHAVVIIIADMTMLGEEQWHWLEGVLRQPADVRLVLSSIQLAVAGHGWERWGLFPTELQRFYTLIDTTHAAGVVILSGDRHIGAIYRAVDGAAHLTNGVADGPYAIPYPIYEITASALTHTFTGHETETCSLDQRGQFGQDSDCDEPGPNRIGPLIHLNNLVSAAAVQQRRSAW